MSGKANNRSDHKIVIERTYEASIEDVWALWTIREGIESWVGPEGFSVKVHKLDLRAGGQMVYAMTAVDPPPGFDHVDCSGMSSMAGVQGGPVPIW